MLVFWGFFCAHPAQCTRNHFISFCWDSSCSLLSGQQPFPNGLLYILTLPRDCLKARALQLCSINNTQQLLSKQVLNLSLFFFFCLLQRHYTKRLVASIATQPKYCDSLFPKSHKGLMQRVWFAATVIMAPKQRLVCKRFNKTHTNQIMKRAHTRSES